MPYREEVRHELGQGDDQGILYLFYNTRGRHRVGMRCIYSFFKQQGRETAQGSKYFLKAHLYILNVFEFLYPLSKFPEEDHLAEFFIMMSA